MVRALRTPSTLTDREIWSQNRPEHIGTPAVLKTMKRCPYCGRQNADETVFCYECGTKFVPAKDIVDSGASAAAPRSIKVTLVGLKQKWMLRFLYIAGTVNFVFYALSATAYADAPRSGFEGLELALSNLISLSAALVLSIMAGVLALRRKGESWHFWIATLVCATPIIYILLEAAEWALRKRPTQ
jgi:hypothetical protein